MKKTLIFCCIFIVCSTYPMKKITSLISQLKSKKKSKQELKEETRGVCYLALLPDDIQNLIAEYLPFPDREDEREFVERARKVQQGDKNNPIKQGNFLIKLMEEEVLNMPSIFGYYLELSFENTIAEEKKNLIDTYSGMAWEKEDIFSCSADASKVIMTNNFEGTSIFDTRKNKQIYKVEAPKQGFINKTIASAISNDGTLIACIEDLHFYKVRPSPDGKGKILFTKNSPGPYILTCKNINNNTEAQPISLPNTIKKLIAFNKQATQIIVFETTDTWHDKYHIFLSADEQEHVQKSKKTFNNFLQKWGICKDLRTSVNHTTTKVII